MSQSEGKKKAAGEFSTTEEQQSSHNFNFCRAKRWRKVEVCDAGGDEGERLLEGFQRLRSRRRRGGGGWQDQST